jgi:hypothetical protein
MCYDHLAGRLGVMLADALSEQQHIEFSDDGGVVTPSGEVFLTKFGIDLSGARKNKRLFCRPCLDWSERRPHLAGVVGGALCRHCFTAGWIKHIDGTRAVAITAKGQRQFREIFGIG